MEINRRFVNVEVALGQHVWMCVEYVRHPVSGFPNRRNVQSQDLKVSRKSPALMKEMAKCIADRIRSAINVDNKKFWLAWDMDAVNHDLEEVAKREGEKDRKKFYENSEQVLFSIDRLEMLVEASAMLRFRGGTGGGQEVGKFSYLDMPKAKLAQSLQEWIEPNLKKWLGKSVLTKM
jgi:hypothetical protein